mmetsp:Transcript_7948/g.16141  ORF Transcript_7948/g.16141 Transcript_7948/m.16141 type:complete len:241 (+) Transcript_7948:70-792(+)|eukprot:CAMPEP_0170361118 /NCGR_PEP_ID=MMETSP0117_2-20130122/3639_1 /TAXON_ID=400756 /ORGANISM="Durinskia baltica, Strain CSIRO CS-38" /LENGTH=240 /DNA_ID=CAMNT_0010615469 /DNA_START=70 /DNA_END=792 /DNA_ORIENTATION=+
MPKRKAAKVGNKEFRALMFERMERIGNQEPVIGEPIPQDALKGFNSFDQSASLTVDMSTRTGEFRSARVGFYNGRGNDCSVFIPYSDGDEFPEAIGKAVVFGLHEAMQHPADELNADLIGITVEGVEWMGDDAESMAQKVKMSKKATNKRVSFLTGYVKDGHFDWLADTPPVVIRPVSDVANNSLSVQPELDKCVMVRNYHDNLRELGAAGLQRVIFALSREEANLHPDGKYHGDRKWAD